MTYFSFCLVTEQTSENLYQIHHRQLVILNEKDVNKPTNNRIFLIQNLIIHQKLFTNQFLVAFYEWP